MKKIFCGFLVLACLIFFASKVLAVPADQPKLIAELSGWQLPEHEKMTFRVKWMGLTAGEITTEIKGVVEFQGRKAYLIEVRARTMGFCSTIYKVDSRYVSYLDVENLYTLRHEVYRREGGYKKDAVTDFDQEKHQAHFRSFTDGSQKTFPIPARTQDTVTAAFVARLYAFSKERPLELSVCNNERVYESSFNVSQRTMFSVPGMGKKDVFLIKPTDIFNGKYVRQGRMNGYVGADPGHTPYYIVIKAPVFTRVTATLVAQVR